MTGPTRIHRPAVMKGAAEILAVVQGIDPADRLDALAVAVRAWLDGALELV